MGFGASGHHAVGKGAMRKGHLSNFGDVHVEEMLPHGTLDFHRRTAPAPLDAPVSPHEHHLPGVEDLELLRVCTEVAQDRTKLRPRRVTGAEVLAVLHLNRDRRLVTPNPRFPSCFFLLLIEARRESFVQLLHLLNPLIEIVQAVPDEEPSGASLNRNRAHTEHTRNDALTLRVAAKHALDANCSRVQKPEQLVDANTAEHPPDVLLNALSSREPATLKGELLLKSLLPGVLNAQAGEPAPHGRLYPDGRHVTAPVELVLVLPAQPAEVSTEDALHLHRRPLLTLGLKRVAIDSHAHEEPANVALHNHHMNLILEEFFTHLQIALLDDPPQIHLSDMRGGFVHPVLLDLPNFRNATASQVHPHKRLHLRGRLVEPHLLEVLHAQTLETFPTKLPTRVPLKDSCEVSLALKDHLLLQPLMANFALDFHPPPRLKDRRGHYVMTPKKTHINAAKTAPHEALDVERSAVEPGELRAAEVPCDVPLDLDRGAVAPEHAAHENPAHAALNRDRGVDVLPAVAVVVAPTTLDLRHAGRSKLEVVRVLDAEFAVPLPVALD